MHEEILEMFDFSIIFIEKLIDLEIVDVIDGVIGCFDQLAEYGHIFVLFELVGERCEVETLCGRIGIPWF